MSMQAWKAIGIYPAAVVEDGHSPTSLAVGLWVEAENREEAARMYYDHGMIEFQDGGFVMTKNATVIVVYAEDEYPDEDFTGPPVEAPD